MREKFAQHSINFIGKYYKYEGKQLDKLNYGLQTFYSLFTKTTVILVFALLLGQIKETVIMVIAYGLVRAFAFGLHASSSLLCWLITIPIYIVIPSISKLFFINQNLIYFFLGIIFISFLLFAPADTIKRPLINRKKRLIDKICSLVVVICFSIIIIFSKEQWINNILLFSLIIEAICINPITYKLLKIPYNNYKTYVKKV